jgi:hypothetical protein
MNLPPKYFPVLAVSLRQALCEAGHGGISGLSVHTTQTNAMRNCENIKRRMTYKDNGTYSLLKFFMGLFIPAFTACKPTIDNVMNIAVIPAKINTQPLMLIR